ncbi:MAG: hypothetical protein FJ271_11635 [Planctomycetes bacterium]|nr:hypothetical protein [Planctomycetota bacterium]
MPPTYSQQRYWTSYPAGVGQYPAAYSASMPNQHGYGYGWQQNYDPRYGNTSYTSYPYSGYSHYSNYNMPQSWPSYSPYGYGWPAAR